MGTSVIRVDDVVIRYGGTVAAGPVTLTVEAGRSLAIVGASGSGKTSLLLAIAGLLRPSSGAVSVGAHSLWELGERQRVAVRREVIGYVAQFGDLVPELTLVENVALPLRLRGETAQVAERSALEQLDEFGIARLAGRFPDEVSGGELQRAALARCLIGSPLAIIADEPTAALDEDNRERATRQLLDAARKRNCAVVLATHDVHLAQAADRVMVLDGHTSNPS